MLNCKIKCVIGSDYFVKDKIYDVVNGHITDEEDYTWKNDYRSLMEINNSFEAQFILVEEQQEQPTYWKNICELNSKQEQKRNF